MISRLIRAIAAAWYIYRDAKRHPWPRHIGDGSK